MLLLSLYHSVQQPSTFAQARTIINADGFGLRGLNKGLTATLGRHGVFNMIYFGFYFNVKDAIPASQVNAQSKLYFSLICYVFVFSFFLLFSALIYKNTIGYMSHFT